MASYNEQYYDDIHDGIHDSEQHTPLPLVVSTKPINCASPSMQEFLKEDADVTRYERKRKKPEKLKDFNNPDTAKINRLNKKLSLRTKQDI